MGVPSCTTVHLITALSLVSADGILDRTGHHMVNARHTVSRRRSLKENEFRSTFPQLKGFLKSMILLPSVKHLVSDRHKVKTFIFLKCHN